MTLFAIGDIWTNCIDKHCWGHEYAEFPIRHEQDPAMRDANSSLIVGVFCILQQASSAVTCF